MTKRVQLAGGSAELEQVLVGLDRELRVDQDNDALRLHDGAKEGGYLFLNRDANDTRYQARSLELDGFNFSAQGKGLLVRVGPAAYKLRKLTANLDEFVITNPRGTAGDFYFELAAIIATEHEWSGTQTFDEAIIAAGGVVGNLTGNVVGNVTGNLTGNVTGNVTGDLTGTFTGDVDVRGFTILFDDGQIPESALDPSILVNRGVPLGAILLWSGAADAIPASWHLCDGASGTPDLRDKFVVGAGGTHAVGDAGGSGDVALTGTLAAGGAHTHTGLAANHALTVAEIPAHHHLNGVTDDHDYLFGHGTGPASPTGHSVMVDTVVPAYEGLTTDTGDGGAHSHALTVDNGGDHSHDLTLDNATIMPPYYALCYIMKIV